MMNRILLLFALQYLYEGAGGETRGRYVMLNGTNYYIGKEGDQDLYTNALGRCFDIGMSLVSLETPEEIEMLHIELSKDPLEYDRNYWTSAINRFKDPNQIDSWRWKISSDEEIPLTFTYWEIGEPNIINSFEFYCIRFSPNRDSKWTDQYCNYDVAYMLCEE